MEEKSIGIMSRNAPLRKNRFDPKRLVVVLRDIKYDGLIMYKAQKSKADSRPKEMGYCFKCKKCLGSYKNIFAHKKQFPSHIKNFYKCSDCKSYIIGREKFQNHVMLHMENRSAEDERNYDLCGSSDTESSLAPKKHNFSREKNGNLLKCEICRKTFKLQQHLANHMLWHSGKLKYKCAVCGRGFIHQYLLKNHMTRYHGKSSANANPLQKSFNHKSNAKNKVKTQQCPRCPETFSELCNFMIHLQMKHCIRCEVCDMIFNNEEAIEDHLNEHNLDTMTCNLCQKVLLDVPFSKRQHIIRNHDGLYECLVCQKIFVVPSTLRQHYKFMHPSVERFQCDQCGDIFLQKAAFVKHTDWCASLDPETGGQFATGVEDVETELKEVNDIKPNIVKLKDAPNEEVESTEQNESSKHVNCTNCQAPFPNLTELQKHLFSFECTQRQPNGNETADASNDTSKVLNSQISLADQPLLNIIEGGKVNNITDQNKESMRKPQDIDMSHVQKERREDEEIKGKKRKMELEKGYCAICKIYFRNTLKLDAHKWRVHYPETVGVRPQDNKGVGSASGTKPRRTSTDEPPKKRKKSADEMDKTGPEEILDSGRVTQPKALSTETTINSAIKLNGNRNGAAKTPASEAKEKLFQCNVCRKKYWKSTALEAHIERRHTQDPKQSDDSVRYTNVQNADYSLYNTQQMSNRHPTYPGLLYSGNQGWKPSDNQLFLSGGNTKVQTPRYLQANSADVRPELPYSRYMQNIISDIRKEGGSPGIQNQVSPELPYSKYMQNIISDIRKDGASPGPVEPCVQNQINIKIDTTGVVQNVCVPVVITGFSSESRTENLPASDKVLTPAAGQENGQKDTSSIRTNCDVRTVQMSKNQGNIEGGVTFNCTNSCDGNKQLSKNVSGNATTDVGSESNLGLKVPTDQIESDLSRSRNMCTPEPQKIHEPIAHPEGPVVLSDKETTPEKPGGEDLLHYPSQLEADTLDVPVTSVATTSSSVNNADSLKSNEIITTSVNRLNAIVAAGLSVLSTGGNASNEANIKNLCAKENADYVTCPVTNSSNQSHSSPSSQQEVGYKQDINTQHGPVERAKESRLSSYMDQSLQLTNNNRLNATSRENTVRSYSPTINQSRDPGNRPVLSLVTATGGAGCRTIINDDNLNKSTTKESNLDLVGNSWDQTSRVKTIYDAYFKSYNVPDTTNQNTSSNRTKGTTYAASSTPIPTRAPERQNKDSTSDAQLQLSARKAVGFDGHSVHNKLSFAKSQGTSKSQRDDVLLKGLLNDKADVPRKFGSTVRELLTDNTASVTHTEKSTSKDYSIHVGTSDRSNTVIPTVVREMGSSNDTIPCQEMQDVTGTGFIVSCFICDQPFKRINTLLRHLKYEHD